MVGNANAWLPSGTESADEGISLAEETIAQYQE
jgi:hypothetical protein